MITSSSATSSSVLTISSSVAKSNAAAKDKAIMDKAYTAVRRANHKLTLNNNSSNRANYYYKTEKQYLLAAKLYNKHYYYDFDTKNSKYFKLSRLAYVHNSKHFTKHSRIYKLKKGNKIKVGKVMTYGKQTRIQIGHNQYITGLKTFIYKLN
ncbi:DUF5776 domain-containing protein [Lactobacillaceae bacterium Melli_B3]